MIALAISALALTTVAAIILGEKRVEATDLKLLGGVHTLAQAEATFGPAVITENPPSSPLYVAPVRCDTRNIATVRVYKLARSKGVVFLVYFDAGGKVVCRDRREVFIIGH